MTASPMDRILATIDQARQDRTASAAAIETVTAERLLHFLPDDQVEALNAKCKTCGMPTPGVWQHAHGGRRIRTPSEHRPLTAPADRSPCPGSFDLAYLTTTPERN